MAHNGHNDLARDNCLEISHYARQVAEMLEDGVPLQPWMADLISKCRGMVGEVKHRMETRSGKVGAPVADMGSPVADIGAPLADMGGQSGSQRIAAMRRRNKRAAGPAGKNPYHRYKRRIALQKKK